MLHFNYFNQQSKITTTCSTYYNCQSASGNRYCQYDVYLHEENSKKSKSGNVDKNVVYKQPVIADAAKLSTPGRASKASFYALGMQLEIMMVPDCSAENPP